MKDTIKIGFDEFIHHVSDEDTEFVTEIHNELMNQGCKVEVKLAKRGYVVSYIFNKKTVSNYVFRKSGLMIRIYANNVNKYINCLDDLPNKMIATIQKATDCKRLINPESCNLKCSKGYDFLIKGEHFQKCRNNAFMFLVTEENNPYIKTILLKEIAMNQLV